MPSGWTCETRQWEGRGVDSPSKERNGGKEGWVPGKPKPNGVN